MAIQVINVGLSPNDGTGDSIRAAYQKCNTNFSLLNSRFRPSIPDSPLGNPGDTAGMYAATTGHLYYCFQDYDGSSEIWRRIAGSSFE